MAAFISGCGSVGEAPAKALTPPPAIPSESAATPGSALAAASPTAQAGAPMTSVSALRPLLSFTPYLYSSLPAGHQVVAILPEHPSSQAVGAAIPMASVNSFTTVIEGAQGEYSIEINEELMSNSPSAPNYIDNPRDPLIAFKSELTPVTLANGQWFEMQLPQGQNLVFAGAWDLYAQRGDVQVEVGGFDSKATLEQFAGSFTFSTTG